MSEEMQFTTEVTKETPTSFGSETETESEKKTDPLKGKEVKLTVKSTSEFDQLCYSQEFKQYLFMSSIQAPYFRADNRAPIDLVCVVDESGSMSGERIDLVKQTLEFIVKNLESNDRFGCVGYESSARRVLELTKWIVMEEQKH